MVRHSQCQTVLVFFFVLLSLPNKLHAEVKLPALISDGMVLQQGVKANVWGFADPGEHVTVTLHNQEASTVAGSDGKWTIKVGPFLAGGPYTLTVAGKTRIVIHDVLVGEVWVCSGQSNMSMTVGPTAPPYFTGVTDFQNELHNADYPMIHLFTVAITVASKPQSDVKGYWTPASPDSVNAFSAAGYFFARELFKALHVPIGMVHASLGSTTAETWTSRHTIESDPDFKPILEKEKQTLSAYPRVFDEFQQQFKEWKENAEHAESEGTPILKPPKVPDDPRQDTNRPSALFNGMIAPVTSYTIKGVIWYQGESNADRPVQYQKLFPALIRDWRNAWGEGNFPFLFVQLASWGIGYSELNLPALREAQAMSLSLPNTGMAVATDIGDGTDGHPKDKQDIGYRLALTAMGVAYGQDVIYSGPVYDSMAVEGDKVRVRFKNVYGGLTAKNWPPGARSGFEIAGDDRKLVEAKAQIEGDTVVVQSDSVTHPIAIRFNWKNNPWYHLYNHGGLPAAPFRTDDWPDTSLPR
jgi:sialate O-acetylesterase